MEYQVTTVGDLREMLSVCGDDEPMEVILDDNSRHIQLRFVNATSAAGGRAVRIWLERK
jgi:hypothetical protein